MATLIKWTDEGTSIAEGAPNSQSVAFRHGVYSGVYTDAEAQTLSDTFDGTAHPDDSNLICRRANVSKRGNGIADVMLVYQHADFSAGGLGAPILYVNHHTERVWLPDAEYNSGDPRLVTFRGQVQKVPYKLFVAEIHMRPIISSKHYQDLNKASLSLAGGTNIGKLNRETWYGLTAGTVQYVAVKGQGYEYGTQLRFYPWHLFLYKKWDGRVPTDPTTGDPLSAHADIYISSGVPAVDVPDTAGAGEEIYKPFG